MPVGTTKIPVQPGGLSAVITTMSERLQRAGPWWIPGLAILRRSLGNAAIFSPGDDIGGDRAMLTSVVLAEAADSDTVDPPAHRSYAERKRRAHNSRCDERTVSTQESGAVGLWRS